MTFFRAQFTFSAAVSLARPLFVVTMASQNLPGAAVMRATGYERPVSALITFLVTLSGVVIIGIGSAFWGVVAGSLALLVQQYGSRNTD